MKAEEFRKTIAALGFNQTQIARGLLVESRTVRRWAAGDREVPGPVVALLQLLKECPDARRIMRGKALTPSEQITGFKADGVYIDELQDHPLALMASAGVPVATALRALRNRRG